jgi:ribosome-binding protein aMBF1 (putative translation factor)
MTTHCHACGKDWTSSRQPGRGDCCTQCRADLRVCLNCKHFDKTAAYQCRERRADPVQEKAAANFCEYFEFVRRTFAGKAGNSREESARAALRSLLGDD